MPTRSCRPAGRARAATPSRTIQRYKGLGEMSTEQLWETTMNPETRSMMPRARWRTPSPPTSMFTLLMGDQVEPRQRVHRRKRQAGGRIWTFKIKRLHSREYTLYRIKYDNYQRAERLIPLDIEEELKNSLHLLCHGGHRQPRPARRARRPQARAPAHSLFHDGAGHDPRQALPQDAPASWATCWVNTTPTATSSVYDAMVRLAQDFYHPLHAGGGPGQLRLRGRRRRGGHALHRGAPDQALHGNAAATSTRKRWISIPTSTKR